MKNFQVIEKIELSRVWEAPATTAYAALDMFREGRARFMNDVPARPRPLVSVTVVDPDTQADFTEKQLDKEMADMVGPAIDTPEGLEEALALEPGSLVEALTMPPGKAAAVNKVSHEVARYLEGVVGVIWANSFESMCLYERWQARGKQYKETGAGYGCVVGKLAGKDVFVSVMTAMVEGHKILLLDPTSVVVDYDMIEEWLLLNLDPTAARNRANALNASSVIPRQPPAPEADNTQKEAP